MRLRRPSHATVIAYLALFLALSGTALAVKKIGPSGLKKNAVTTKKIADAAVNTSKLKDGAVTEPKLKDDAVTGQKLAANAVGTNKLKDDAVESAKIANGAVVEAKIGNDAVTGSKVADGSLALADIAQLAADVNTTDFGSIPAGNCVSDSGIVVPGLQTGDAVLAFPRNTAGGWDQGLVLDAYGPVSAGTVQVRVCSTAGGPIDPPPLPLTVLGFR
jgi:hypothetical protein